MIREGMFTWESTHEPERMVIRLCKSNLYSGNVLWFHVYSQLLLKPLYFHIDTCSSFERKVNTMKMAEEQSWLAAHPHSWQWAWAYLVTLNGTAEVFCFPFHVQLSLGRIIALQSLVRWGSCGPQHFPFRPGLPSAHCQHQDEWALMQHRWEWGVRGLPGKGRQLPKSTRCMETRRKTECSVVFRFVSWPWERVWELRSCFLKCMRN